MGVRRPLAAAVLLALAPVGPPAGALPLPRVSVSLRPEVAEGADAGIVVRLDRPAARAVSVRLDTRSDRAHGRVDYTPMHTTVVLAAGATRAVVPVATTDDGLDEANEAFRVRLSAPERAVLDADRESVTILDGDPLPDVLPQDATVQEPSTRNQLGFTTVRLSRPSGRRVLVTLSTRPGTAGFADFVPLHPTVVFAPGQTSQPVSVEVLPDDLVEGLETVRLVVASVRHARVGRVGVVTIDDADSPRAGARGMIGP